MSPKVFIIILNWNGLQDTLECLDSIRRCSYKNYHVLVVDNGSTDDSVSSIKSECPWVTIIQNAHNLGFTGGNNVGIRYAFERDADYVWLLNNDTVVELDTLSKLVGTAETDSSIGMISPVIKFYDDTSMIQNCGGLIDWENQKLSGSKSIAESAQWLENAPDRIWLWGTALLIKAKTIADIGLLDENIFAYWEDTDYSVRAIRAGYFNVVEFSTQIYHKTTIPMPGVTLRSPHYFYYMVRNEYYFWMKHARGTMKLKFIKNYFGNVVYRAAPAINQDISDCVRACFLGARDGVLGVCGPWNKDAPVSMSIKLLIRLFSWHPYFWAPLLKLDFAEILRNIR